VVENGARDVFLVVENGVVVVGGQMAAARGPETPRPLVFTGNEVRGVQMGWGWSKTGGG
jgi:hypothetical protein